MTKQAINIVWLKRDLRTQDHLPLSHAERSEFPYLVIYIFEPSVISHPDTSERHLQFVYHSILSIDVTWRLYNRSVRIFYGEAEAVFGYLYDSFTIKSIFSYQESGIQLTYARDLKLKKFFRPTSIEWQEFQRDGIQRAIINRDGWDKAWYVTMDQPLVANAYSVSPTIHLAHAFEMPSQFLNTIRQYPTEYQPAGEAYGWKYLQSFAHERGFNYARLISKPLESRTACSRLSPYLAWGNLSIKQAYQFSKKHPNYAAHRWSFDGFLSRLKWHCHFIQKFEVECSYEFSCINRGYESLHHVKNGTYIRAWEEGQTGYVLVDACMRCVRATGWINFRMRAMVVSFLCHHLFQDWREGAYYLARQFLDYEPGIHYPQFQMQAGTTGINTVRIYNPTKQSHDHDPKGIFIKRWVPELALVTVEHIHEPHKMTPMEQQLSHCIIGVDYPYPIVSPEGLLKEAREAIWSHRKDKTVKQENQRILKTHTRRKSEEESDMG